MKTHKLTDEDMLAAFERALSNDYEYARDQLERYRKLDAEGMLKWPALRVLLGKFPRAAHRPSSLDNRLKQFYRSPNRILAAMAAELIQRERTERKRVSKARDVRPYKSERADVISDSIIKSLVANFNSSPAAMKIGLRADTAQVKTLVRKGRTKRPSPSS